MAIVSLSEASQVCLKQVANFGNFFVAFVWRPAKDDIAPSAFDPEAGLANVEAAEFT